MEKVEYTNGIPICPYCKVPTQRQGGLGSITAAYYKPVYNEKGVNTNPDRNTQTSSYHCSKCNKKYGTKGNHVDGFKYILS